MSLPSFSITAQTVRFLMETEALKERIRYSASAFPSEVSVLAQHLCADQIYHASLLEGGELSAEQVAQVVSGATALPASTTAHAEEIDRIRGYKKAREQVEQWAKEGVWMTESALQALHGLIVSGGENMDHSPYREEALRLYDKTARSGYMTPPPAMIPELMYNMVTELQQSRVTPAPLRAAQVHYAMMSLQPFTSDNQLIALLAAHWMLAEEGYTLDGLLGLEPYYARNFMLYADVVGTRPSSSHYSARLRADVTEWASYLAEMTALSARHALVKLEALGAVISERPHLFLVEKDEETLAPQAMLAPQPKTEPTYTPAPAFAASQVTEIFGPVESSHAADESESENAEEVAENIADEMQEAANSFSPALISPIQLVKPQKTKANAEPKAEAESANTAELDARQRKVLKLFEKNDVILARQIRALFKIQPRTASGLCKDWVEQGFLKVEDPSNKARSYRLGTKHQATSSNVSATQAAVKAVSHTIASHAPVRRRPATRRVSLGNNAAIRLRLRES